MSPRGIAWIDRLIWILIYGGLFTLVLGIASGDVHVIAGWSLGVLGALAAAAGFILIGVRSRLQETPPDAASSSSTKSTP